MKIIRMSGLPVNMDHLEAFDKAFKAGFDEISAEVDKDMDAMQLRLKALDEELKKQYPNEEEAVAPRSLRDIGRLIEHYGYPVFFAKRSDNSSEVVCIIADMPVG